MAYGISTYRADGVTPMTTGGTKGLVFIESFAVTGSTSGSRTYTQVAGNSLVAYAIIATGDSNHATVSTSVNGSGQGVLSYTTSTVSPSATITIMVFATKLATVDLYGIQLRNDNDEVVADINYPTPQLAGSVQTRAQPYAARYNYNATYVTYSHITDPINFRPGTVRFVAMAIPDVGSNDIWYSCDSFIPDSVTSAVQLVVTVYAPAGVAYTVPKLHVFSVNNPVDSGALFAVKLTTPTGSLMYDSGAENICITDSTIATYNFSASNTYSMTVPSSAAIVTPSCATYTADEVGFSTVYSKYLGMVKRVGNQVTTKYIGVPLDTPVATGSFGQDVGYLAVLDVAAYGALGVTNVAPSNIDSAPIITSQPASTGTKYEGDTASFSITVTAYPAPTYQWRKNGSNISGATGSSYSFTVGASDNTGTNYSCVVSNIHGSVTSANATLTVSHPASPTPPVFSQQPSSVSASTGGSASMSVAASPVTSYQWYRNSVAVSGATGASITLDTSSTGSFTYYCIAYNGGYSTQSNSATLTVSGSAPVISTQPVNTTTPVGTPAAMTCYASPVTEIRWYLNAVDTGVTGNTYYPPYGAAGSWGVQAVCSNGASQTYSAYVSFTVTSGSGPYPSYNNLMDENVDVYDDVATYGVAGSDAWHNGSGDYTLYDIQAASGSGSPMSGGDSPINTWLSFASNNYYQWTLRQPTTFKSGASTYRALNIQIRLRSSGAIVSQNTVYLSSTNS